MNEKIKRLAQSKLFILPTYEENWAIVIGEAMASGTPVISYALEPLINVWGENVTFIPVGNKELFANKIVNLLNDNIYMNEICKVGIDFIKKFDWESIAEKELEYILG
jgi:glycosyltransferase involved in cell wall biosynthesis